MKYIKHLISTTALAITCTTLLTYSAPKELQNTYWQRLVDTKQGLADHSRTDLTTEIGNQNSIWTLINYDRVPYIFKYDNMQSMWIAHTNLPFDKRIKDRAIRVQSDGNLYAIARGLAYRWIPSNEHWKKIAGTKAGLPKRAAKIMMDVSNDDTVWALATFKRKAPRLYTFDKEKNMWIVQATCPIKSKGRNLGIRAHTTGAVYVKAEGEIYRYNRWKKDWDTMVKSKKGLPKHTKKIMTEIAPDGSAWAVAIFKRKPSHLYRYDVKKKLWVPHAILPFDKNDKDHDLRIHAPNTLFVTADSVVYQLRK